VLSYANNVGKCDFAGKDDDVNSRDCKEDRKRDVGQCGDDVLKRGERHSSFFLSSSCSSLALQRLLAAYLVLLADSEDNNGGNSARGECKGVEDDGDGCWGCCGKHVMSEGGDDTISSSMVPAATLHLCEVAVALAISEDGGQRGAARWAVIETSWWPVMLLTVTRVRIPLATQRSYSDMLSAFAGCGGRLALNPPLTVLAQEGSMLEWLERGREVVGCGHRLLAGQEPTFNPRRGGGRKARGGVGSCS
jgi:hypothetical protein